MNKGIIFGFACLLHGSILCASVSDSIKEKGDSSTIHFFSGTDRYLHFIKTYTDTSLNGFQNYLPLELRGGLSSPTPSFAYSIDREIGFKYQNRSFVPDGHTQNAIKYFRTRTPYTSLLLVLASKKEQYFNLLHTQNITKNWNVALGLTRANGEGFYQRQNMSYNNISFSSNYFSKNEQYGLLLSYKSQGLKRDENGGISSDSLWQENIFANKKLFGVNLSQARTRTLDQEVKVSNIFYLKRTQVDTIKDGSSVRREVPKSYLCYAFDGGSSRFVYSDKEPRGGFYDNVILDTNMTLDSTHMFHIGNEIKWRQVFRPANGTGNNFNSDISARQDHYQLFQQVSDTILDNYSATLTLFTLPVRPKEGTTFLVEGAYVFAGNAKGDGKIEFEMEHNFGERNGTASIHVMSKLSSPAYLFLRHSSNNFWWYNDLEKEQQTNVALSYSSTKLKFKIEGSYSLLDSYIYFDSTFLPIQMNNSFGVLQVRVEKNLRFKHLAFDNNIVFQKASDETALRIPTLVLKHSIYYKGNWFKNVMEVNAGADILYFSSYFGDAYMPALRAFYIQNSIQVGNYPFIDLFFDFKIKKVRIFVKADHVASGLLGTNYFIVPHYPGNDRQIKVGINWKFFD